jgi:hypothetical protein
MDLAVDFMLGVFPVLFTGSQEDAVSSLPAVLHDLLPVFAASRYWDRESEGDNEESRQGAKYMEYYQQGKLLRRSRDLHLNGDKPLRWEVV